ncbi:MAG: hypothetical protein H2048_08285 [Erythrobacter sp.]|jgi:Papain family cysteine protease|nr:hypothetical protein [Erythrobacter sp.]
MVGLTIKEIRQALVKAGEPWKAQDSPLLHAANRTDDLSGMFGLRMEDTTGRLAPASDDVFGDALESPPDKWNWVDEGRVTGVRDQGACGACVAFATCAVMEARHWITSGDELVLSPGHLFFCNGGHCDSGWGLAHGFEAARKGVALEREHPWSPDGVCRSIDPVVAVRSFSAHRSSSARKRAIVNGPVLAGMRVYRDLFAYAAGIYRHVTGDQVGLHAVCVVGYDDDEQCWIVKNSWGDEFGEDGFMRIGYGQCGIDTDFDFYSAMTVKA